MKKERKKERKKEMNKVILIGNLTKDPETKVTSNDIPVTTFSIAVTRRSNKENTDFFNIVTWRGLAENCGRFLAKGRKVAVIGELQTRTYEGNDGNKRYVTEIVAEEVEFLTPKTSTAMPENLDNESLEKSGFEVTEEDEDLPF